MKKIISMIQLRKLGFALCIALALCQVAPSNLGIPATALAASKVGLNKTKASIYNGKTLQLKLSGTKKEATWSSSDKKIAKVNQKGKVTAKKAGKATITAKVGKKKYTCKLTVKPALSLKKSKLSIKAGEKGKVGVTYALDGTLKCKTSNKKVATGTVKKSGSGFVLVVTAKKVGKATITLSNSLTNDKDTLNVTVKRAETGDRTELYYYLGKSFDELNAALGGKLKKTTEDGLYAYKGIEAFADSTCVYSISLKLDSSSDGYQLCGVHSGMTRKEADSALKGYDIKLDIDFGEEDGAEFYGKDSTGKDCMFSYDYKGDQVTWATLWYSGYP